MPFSVVSDASLVYKISRTVSRLCYSRQTCRFSAEKWKSIKFSFF